MDCIDVEKKRQELIDSGELTEVEIEQKLSEYLIRETDRLQAEYKELRDEFPKQKI